MKHVLISGKISKLGRGESNEVSLVEYNKNKFILREYEDEKTADYNVLVHKKLYKYGFFPKILYKEKRKVLFEYIEGRDCKKSDALKVAKQVGRICALINSLKLHANNEKQSDIEKIAEILKKNNFLNYALIEKLVIKYNKLKSKVHPKKAIEFDDIHAKNFRIRKGIVYLVDIEEFYYMIKGRDVGKAFLRWFKTEKQRKKFKQGYESVSSMKFITKDYLQFLFLNFLAFNIASKLKRNKEVNPKDKSRLLEILNDK